MILLHGLGEFRRGVDTSAAIFEQKVRCLCA